MELSIIRHLSGKQPMLFKCLPIVVLILSIFSLCGYCQINTGHSLKELKIPSIPKKKDTIIYSIITSTSDTFKFDITKKLLFKELDENSKAVLTTAKSHLKINFLQSDTLMAEVVCSIRRVRCDTIPVFSILDVSQLWYLKIIKYYYCDITNANLKKPIEVIRPRVVANFLRKAINAK